MVLLQDLEEKLKKDNKKKHVNTPFVKASAWFGLSVFVLGIGAIIYALTVYTGKNGTNTITNSTNRHVSSVVPLDERAKIVQASLANGTFAILAAPDVKSGQSESTVSYDLRIVRKQGFTDDINLDLDNVPAGASASVSPETITRDATDAVISITLPKDAKNGTYTVAVVGNAGPKTARADVAVAVSALELSNTEVTDVQPMQDGTKWQATIHWKTNARTNSWIEYASETTFIESGLSYSFTAVDQNATNEHAITLAYLEPNTVYHYRARSVDPQNTVVVGDDRTLETQE